mmetsp:Transcript_48108/g.120525  ORF Transcript_48108/g.120525 Transcript_48108/m.120525 type:complete len:245 (-) Transcript_48108:345-1079(-)
MPGHGERRGAAGLMAPGSVEGQYELDFRFLQLADGDLFAAGQHTVWARHIQKAARPGPLRDPAMIERLRCADARLRVPGQHARQQVLCVCRDALPVRPLQRNGPLQDWRQHLVRAEPRREAGRLPEGQPPREHLRQHHARAPDVAAAAGAPQEDLRRRVQRRAGAGRALRGRLRDVAAAPAVDGLQEVARGPQRGGRAARRHPRAGLPAVDEVAGLEVAVHDAARVQVRQQAENVVCCAGRLCL